ncbi:ricin-type beta-trefoil lectin domain protein [Streptomyces sp. NPDC005336]|uniref:ricin-type beta-trefoil lectin domain protein n=1 Tax=Streptomyces sp. NPDC005336 TaxID=3157035 RepID=UPI0033A80004
MSDQHGTEPKATAEKRPYAQLPDAGLTERIRAGAPTALPATQELRARHLPAVLSYARLCGRSQTDGNQLAELSLGLAAQETCRGIDPLGPWRHHLLLLVQRVGATWAAGNRRERLDPEFAEWLDGSGITTDDGPGRPRPEERSAMLGGFLTLSARTRGVLWYRVVDDESTATVATYLGTAPHTVATLEDTAQGALREAWLRTHLERTGDPTCQGFRGIIEAAVRPGAARRSEDLDRHLAACPSCAGVFGDLVRMGEDPRTVIADGLLGWGGTAYVMAGPVRALPAAEAVAQSHTAVERPAISALAGPVPAPALPPVGVAADGPAGPGSAGTGRQRTWTVSWPSAAVGLVVVAALTAVATTVAVLASDSGDISPAGGRAPLPTATTAPPTVSAPPPTATATPTKKPPRPSPPARATEAPPTPTPPTTAPPSTSQPTAVPIPGDAYTVVVNSASALCLDIRDARLEKRTDVITAPCAGADTQRWRLDSRGLLHTAADPDFCLDSRGDTDRGVGIWPCSSADGDNGQNLQFVVDRDGVIRPFIAPDFAVTPGDDSPGSSLELQSADGRDDQRWSAR